MPNNNNGVHRLTLMRVSVVEAKNVRMAADAGVRPYVSLRVGNQHGQTRVACGKALGGGARARSGSGGGGSSNGSSGSGSSSAGSGRFCSWNQSFDLVVRQQPQACDLEDFLTLHLLNYQGVARKDLLLGKVELGVETLGDPFRPPDTGRILVARAAVLVAPDTSQSPSTPSSASSTAPPTPTPSSSALSLKRVSASSRRGSHGSTSKGLTSQAVGRGGLSHRCAQDFWVPLSLPWTPQAEHGNHAGELRLRVLLLPIPVTHRLHLAYPWLTGHTQQQQPHAEAFHASSGSGGGSAEVHPLKTVEARDESAEDRELLYVMLRQLVAGARRQIDVAKKHFAQQHRQRHKGGEGFGGGDHSSESESEEEGDSGHEGGEHTASSVAAVALPKPPPPPSRKGGVSSKYGGGGGSGGCGGGGGGKGRGGGAAGTAVAVSSAVGRSRRRRWRRGRLTLRVEERYGWDFDAAANLAGAAASQAVRERAHENNSGGGGVTGDSTAAEASAAAAEEVEAAAEAAAKEVREQEVVDQLVREQHDALREAVVAQHWVKPVAWALRNPLPFGACSEALHNGVTLAAVLAAAAPLHRPPSHSSANSRVSAAQFSRDDRDGWEHVPMPPPSPSASASRGSVSPEVTLASMADLGLKGGSRQQQFNRSGGGSGGEVAPANMPTGRLSPSPLAGGAASVTNNQLRVKTSASTASSGGGCGSGSTDGGGGAGSLDPQQQQQQQQQHLNDLLLNQPPHPFASELRRLVLAGVPDCVRVPHGRGAFRGVPGTWIRTPPPPSNTTMAAPSASTSSSHSNTTDHNDGSNRNSNISSNRSSGADGPAAQPKPPPPPPSVLGRLRCGVPRTHMVTDTNGPGSSHFAGYRIRVALSNNLPPNQPHTTPSTTQKHQIATAPASGGASGGGSGWEAAPFSSPSKEKTTATAAAPQGGDTAAAAAAAAVSLVVQPVVWEVVRRFSEFEALLAFLTEDPRAGTAGTKLRQLVTIAPKSLRSVLKWSMTPEFLEERRLSLETALVVLLDACRQPNAVCGYRGLSLSQHGQRAVLRFLAVPDSLDPSPPSASQLSKLASQGLRRALFLNSPHSSAPSPSSVGSSATSSTPFSSGAAAAAASPPFTSPHQRNDGATAVAASPSLLSGAEWYAYLDHDCDDDDDDDDGDGSQSGGGSGNRGSNAGHGDHNSDGGPTRVRSRSFHHTNELQLQLQQPMQHPVAAATLGTLLQRGQGGVAGASLHFRAFVWLLLSGALRRLSLHAYAQPPQPQTPQPLPSSSSLPQQQSQESGGVIMASASGGNGPASTTTAAVAVVHPSMLLAPFRSFEELYARLAFLDALEAQEAQEKREKERIGSGDGEEDTGEGGSTGSTQASSSQQQSQRRSTEGGGAFGNGGPWRFLSASFSQIDLDIWRTKVKPKPKKQAAPQVSGATSETTPLSPLSSSPLSPSPPPPPQCAVDEPAALRRVLRSFVLCRPAVGYCQAMNYVALFLLRASGKFGDERSAVSVLLALADDVVPGYWTSSMTAMQADMALLNKLVAAALPELSRHLQDIRLPLDLFATQWLVSLFSAALPPPSVARVWDWLFLDGPAALLCVALALLRRSQPRLLLTDDLQVCAELLHSEALAAGDADLLLEEAMRELALCEHLGLHVRGLRAQHAVEVKRKQHARVQGKRHKREAALSFVRLLEGEGCSSNSSGGGGGGTGSPRRGGEVATEEMWAGDRRGVGDRLDATWRANGSISPRRRHSRGGATGAEESLHRSGHRSRGKRWKKRMIRLLVGSGGSGGGPSSSSSSSSSSGHRRSCGGDGASGGGGGGGGGGSRWTRSGSSLDLDDAVSQHGRWLVDPKTRRGGSSHSSRGSAAMSGVIGTFSSGINSSGGNDVDRNGTGADNVNASGEEAGRSGVMIPHSSSSSSARGGVPPPTAAAAAASSSSMMRPRGDTDHRVDHGISGLPPLALQDRYFSSSPSSLSSILPPAVASDGTAGAPTGAGSSPRTVAARRPSALASAFDIAEAQAAAQLMAAKTRTTGQRTQSQQGRGRSMSEDATANFAGLDDSDAADEVAKDRSQSEDGETRVPRPVSMVRGGDDGEFEESDDDDDDDDDGFESAEDYDDDDDDDDTSEESTGGSSRRGHFSSEGSAGSDHIHRDHSGHGHSQRPHLGSGGSDTDPFNIGSLRGLAGVRSSSNSADDLMMDDQPTSPPSAHAILRGSGVSPFAPTSTSSSPSFCGGYGGNNSDLATADAVGQAGAGIVIPNPRQDEATVVLCQPMRGPSSPPSNDYLTLLKAPSLAPSITHNDPPSSPASALSSEGLNSSLESLESNSDASGFAGGDKGIQAPTVAPPTPPPGGGAIASPLSSPSLPSSRHHHSSRPLPLGRDEVESVAGWRPPACLLVELVDRLHGDFLLECARKHDKQERERLKQQRLHRQLQEIKRSSQSNEADSGGGGGGDGGAENRINPYHRGQHQMTTAAPLASASLASAALSPANTPPSPATTATQPLRAVEKGAERWGGRGQGVGGGDGIGLLLPFDSPPRSNEQQQRPAAATRPTSFRHFTPSANRNAVVTLVPTALPPPSPPLPPMSSPALNFPGNGSDDDADDDNEEKRKHGARNSVGGNVAAAAVKEATREEGGRRAPSPQPLVGRGFSDSQRLSFAELRDLLRPALGPALAANVKFPTVGPDEVRVRFDSSVAALFHSFRSGAATDNSANSSSDSAAGSSRGGGGGSGCGGSSPTTEESVDWQEILHCVALLAGACGVAGNNVVDFNTNDPETSRGEASGLAVRGGGSAGMSLDDKLRLCFCVCDRSSVGSVDRSEVFALLQYALDMFAPKVSSSASAAAASTATAGTVAGEATSHPPTVSPPSVAESRVRGETPRAQGNGGMGGIGVGVAYGTDTIPLILDDLFAGEEGKSVARLDLEEFLSAVRNHAPCLDFFLLGGAANCNIRM